ncbi:uncharacterized protein B0I36DRAFT_381499 [Microdochium trichocladiopsis]|uniref:Uncharacterized protein n=1 Tax=Microdochium trichocladiopsis TaxID=1682393 RepID=A0A9P8YAB8_9PEZI|nr:uncharacterized protein B0I36DRAFT_381499 [Microdochium trichocladiopsis]KAH7034597.1 hypothetical protein B0I36DRAFT_381499 [Microdochium trichocladiopsis]
MAPQYRPVARLRLRVRRRVQNVVGIITGTHPGESTTVDEYYSSSSSSSPRSSSSLHARHRQRRNSQYSSRGAGKQQQSYNSLASISESDEEDSITDTDTNSDTGITPSSSVSVFDPDSSDDDDDNDDDEDEEEEGQRERRHDEPRNPFSDYYEADETTAAATTATGSQLVRVKARGHGPSKTQKQRQNNPYRRSMDGEGRMGSKTGGGSAPYRVTLPKGMKWKSTPGAYYGFATTTTTTRRTTQRGDKNEGKPARGQNGLKSSTATATTAAAAAATKPRVIELDWNHTSHGAYQLLRPANPRYVRSFTSGAIAAGGADAGTMMAMLECHTPACEISWGSGSTTTSGAMMRMAEFDGLAGLGYGGFGAGDAQWLEYMSIPSGSLGKAGRWVGRRLGLCGGGGGGGGSGSGREGRSTEEKGSGGGAAGLSGKKSAVVRPSAGNGAVGHVVAPGAAAVRAVSAKRVRFA